MSSRGRARAAGFAAVVAALAVAMPAGAAQKAPAAAPAPAPSRASSAKPSVTPSRVPAASPAAPARAPAPDVLPPPPAPAEPRPRVSWFGVGVGAVSAFDVGKGMAFQLDYGLSRTPASWSSTLALEWHLLGTFSRPTDETRLTTTIVPPYGFPVTIDAGEEKVTALVFEVVPVARVLWSLSRGVAFFAEGGLGLCQTIEEYDRSEMFVGRSTRTDYVTGLVARVGIGMSADVSERWRVVFQPAEFSLQLGAKFSAYTPTLGIAYRL